MATRRRCLLDVVLKLAVQGGGKELHIETNVPPSDLPSFLLTPMCVGQKTE